VHTVKGQRAFVPDPLPRQLSLSPSLILDLDKASRAIATLSGVGETIPNPHLLIGPFTRREAVLSSKIEGTQASLSDLFLFEMSSRHAVSDVREVVNYVRALEEGVTLLNKLPICLRLANSIHSILLEGVRGEERRPGELRTDQNWIGARGTPIEEARYVPPPAPLVPELLLDWENFVNEEVPLPPLIQCALMHYQFEAIHPYFDGNGRIGRLLIVLFLRAKQVLPTPLLYLSAYFERHRQGYYDQLFQVSAHGSWDEWVKFFLDGVTEQANDALLRVRKIRALQEKYREELQKERVSGNVLRLLDALFERPYISAPWAAKSLGVTYAAASGIIRKLENVGIIKLRPGHWPALYVAEELLRSIEAPTISN
jgi:Fic family protein